MIEPRYGVLQSLFADRVFRIPHYQRFYSWLPRQRQDLFSDLEKLMKQNEDQHHFMATLVCYRTSEVKSVGASQYRVYDIVDGQQRLTTLILLLKCIELALPADQEDRKDLARILVKRDGHLILLQTNNANERIFNRFIRDGVQPEDKELQTYSDNNLAGAISDCTRFVKNWTKANGIDSLLSLVLHRLGFVVHDTEDQRAVYTVFEVLNSRGLAVDWLDKTKSMLMGEAYELAASPEAADAEIQSLQNVWSEIYREIARENVSGEEILRVSATLYYGTGAGRPLSSEVSLAQLREQCKSFEMPRRISDQLLDVARKSTSLHGNRLLGPVTEILHARVLAVALMSAKGVNEKERKKLLEQWERVTFRIFQLNSKDSRTMVGDYVRLAVQIVSADLNMRTYNEIMASLKDLGSGYPVAEAVAEGLNGKNCYERPEFCRYVLWLYEEWLANSLGSGGTVDEHERNGIWKLRAVDSIEHIFPQSPEGIPEWKDRMRRGDAAPESVQSHVHRIGNLLLLPITLNLEVARKPFVEKKTRYLKHNLRSVQEVCREADWTLSQIEAREARITEWAKSRWNDF